MSEPTAIVCLTGTELVRGETRDRNGSFLASELSALGFRVLELRLLPDEPALLREGFQDCLRRARLVVVSGGLGPTADDCTVAALATALGRRVTRDPGTLERIRAVALRRLGREDRVPANYYKQAEVVEGSTVLGNPVGLAPGFIAEVGPEAGAAAEGAIAVVLPGVPRELEAIHRAALAAELRRRFGLVAPVTLRAKIVGIPESIAEARIQKLGLDLESLEYGISARPQLLSVRLVAHDAAGCEALARAGKLLEAEFGEDIVFLGDEAARESRELEHSRIVHELLLASGLRVVTAESCTGGLVARRLTDHGGSSAYFLGSVVAYANRIKEDLLAVPPELIERRGAVSPEVCRAMAEGARARLGADCALSITGIAGPGGGSEEKPVGLVYLGLSVRGRAGGAGRDGETLVEEHRFRGDRAAVREQAAVRALDMLRRELERRSRRSRIEVHGDEEA